LSAKVTEFAVALMSFNLYICR